MEKAEVREVEQEEGSNSTLEKDDNEGDDADDEIQVDDALEEHAEQQIMIWTKKKTQTEVKESVLEGDHWEEIISMKFKLSLRVVSKQQILSFIKNLEDS